MNAEATTARTTPRERPGGYDAGLRRRATRAGRQRGCSIYIPADELARAGIDPDGPTPFYRTIGYQRSRNGHTVIVTLYREP